MLNQLRLSIGAVALAAAGTMSVGATADTLTIEDQFLKFATGPRHYEVAEFRFSDGTLARIHDWSARGIDVEIGGRRARSRVTRAGDQLISLVPVEKTDAESEPGAMA